MVYINTAAPLIEAIIQDAADLASPVLTALGADNKRARGQSAHTDRRHQDLLDLAEA